MKGNTVCYLLLLTIAISSCEKDKDDSAADATGYWTGFIEPPFNIFVSVINHPDGTGRSYFSNGLTDTATAIYKANGTWKVTNNVFYGIYSGPVYTANDTVIIQGFLRSPFIEIDGFLSSSGSIGSFPLRLIKNE
jgi:hypothetical protein